ncbi:MAG: NAD(P)/FAD-dependent oxidoreductase [Methanocella sp.]
MAAKDSYDVIVTGGGPAGSITAKEAADRGLDVLLIEKRQEIGEPIRCAEGITADGLREFMEPDPGWISGRIRKARFFSPSVSLEFCDDSDAAYVLERRIFDRDLARMAAGAGADVFTKTQATGLIIENGRTCGIRGKLRGEDFEARAKVVVGADGVESRVGRWAGIDTCLKVKDIGSCAQFRLAGIDLEPDSCEIYYNRGWAPGGYVYIFPKGDGEANVGLGAVYDHGDPRRPIEYLKDFVSWRFPGAGVLESVAGGVPLSGIMSRLSAAGLVLVGDAARLTDPGTGEGILNGMISGRIAGRVIADCVRNGDVSADALRRYDIEIEKKLGPLLQRNYAVKEYLRKCSNARMDVMFRTVKAMRIEKYPTSTMVREVFNPRGRRAAALLGILMR